jgi:ribosome recycling factor
LAGVIEVIETRYLHQVEEKMKKTLELTKKELSGIRTGRATPALLDKVFVEAYGSQMPLKQLASITAPEPRLLVVQPFDKSTLQSIEKALLKSDLGLTPNVDGNLIRLPIPQLTEERRRELVKLVKKMIEDAKVAVRNVRRDANEELESLKKKGGASEDEVRRALEQVQKLTNQYIKELDSLFLMKEKEIMEV